MLGRKVPYFYELELEKFKYSQEILLTGVAGIDEIAAQSAYDITLITAQGTGSFLGNEIVYQSPDGTQGNATAQAYVQAWTPSTDSLVIHNIAGEFLDGGLIIGASSNAQYYLSTFNPLSTAPTNESFDNSYIASSANTVLIRTESNPFGSI
jgi:hypothetical protein